MNRFFGNYSICAINSFLERKRIIMEKNLYPLQLAPVFKEIIWGGDRLKRDFGKVCDFEKLAESWELTCRHDGMNVIQNGPCAGMSLSDYLGEDAKGFPLLIKLIDACDRLSIQVHPDDAYAREKEGEYGKTEMWYIVDADPGAKLVYGLKDYDKETFAAAAKDGTLEKYLNFVEVHKGDVFFIPSGCVHAIGAGILVAEIQQNSNTTFRIYDYGRKDLNGNPRLLHLGRAVEVVCYEPIIPEECRANSAVSFPGFTVTEMFSCQYFRAYRVDVRERIELRCDGQSFQHLLCVEGEGEIIFGAKEYPLCKGDSYFLPAALGEYEIGGACRVLLSRV